MTAFRLTLDLDEQTRARWQNAAHRYGWTIDRWVRDVCTTASDPESGQVVERFRRHVETMIEPTLLARAEAETRLPWAFSAEPAADEETVANEPTPEGRMLGKELARLCDLEETKLRERFPRLHPRCDDCAFRAGTDPNGCPETLMDAIKCIVEVVPFYCHKGVRDGEAKRLCAGYAICSALPLAEAFQ